MNVIVTGGSGGIGLAVALRFAKAGANIVLNDIVAPSDEVVAQVESHGVQCFPVVADISDFEQAKDMINAAKERFGTIDVLVNNAGIIRDGLLIRMSEKDFDDVIRINLKGAFNTIRHVSNIMLRQRSGAIINMASVVGLMGNIGQINYVASKAGLIGLTKTTARELASRGITCNAIAPGFIETEMTKTLPEAKRNEMLVNIQLNRFGATEEVAELAYFLAVNTYITGQVVSVNGGMYM